MKELLRGFYACSLKDDNARLESVAHVTAIVMGNGEYSNDSLITTGSHRSCRGINVETPMCCTCKTGDEALRVDDTTSDALLKVGCEKALESSIKYNHLQSAERARFLHDSSEQLQSKDDMTMVGHMRLELDIHNINSIQDLTKPNLRRSSSLPIESGESESNVKKENSFGRQVCVLKSTRRTMVKNDEVSTSSPPKKLRGVKVNWQDMNPSKNQGKVVYSNPRKLLDFISENAGSAPPSRPERKMSTEDDSPETLLVVSKDRGDTSSERSLPVNDKKLDSGLPVYNQSLVSCLAQEFQTRPPTSNSDRSIIDSVNDLWATSKDVGQDVPSISLLSMAKSGTGTLSRPTHGNDSGKMDVGIGKEQA